MVRVFCMHGSIVEGTQCIDSDRLLMWCHSLLDFPLVLCWTLTTQQHWVIPEIEPSTNALSYSHTQDSEDRPCSNFCLNW